MASVVISLLAFVVSLLSYKLARNAEHRVEGETLARRRPIITLHMTSRPTEEPSAGQVVHEYAVRAGSMSITGLWLWVEDSKGDTISTGAGGEQLTLAPGGGAQIMGVGVLHFDRPGQTLMVRWRDADGEYGPESTGIHPPPHH